MPATMRSLSLLATSASVLAMLCYEPTAAAQAKTGQAKAGQTRTAAAAYTPFAQQGRLGLGVGGSNIASGITGKYYLTNRTALQLAAGSWWGRGLALSGDVIVEMPQLLAVDALSMNWHAGVGAGFFSSNATTLGVGVMGVLGLAFQLEPLPLELVTDIRPSFNVGMEDSFYFYGGGALRYFF